MPDVGQLSGTTGSPGTPADQSGRHCGMKTGLFPAYARAARLATAILRAVWIFAWHDSPPVTATVYRPARRLAACSPQRRS
jgi:hypothetical protein